MAERSTANERMAHALRDDLFDRACYALEAAPRSFLASAECRRAVAA